MDDRIELGEKAAVNFFSEERREEKEAYLAAGFGRRQSFKNNTQITAKRMATTAATPEATPVMMSRSLDACKEASLGPPGMCICKHIH